MSERFEIPCPQCGTLVAASTQHIGKKGRCPACQTVFSLTAPSKPLPALPPASSVRPLPFGLEPLPPGFGPDAMIAPSVSLVPSLFDEVGKPAPQRTGDELSLSDEPYSASSPHAGDQARHVFQRLAEKEAWQQAKIRQDFNSIMWMGVGLMALAAIWFIGGLLLGIIFFLYPPIMFIVGLFLFFKGLFRFAE